MPILLTPSQERALDLTRHLSVTANAGAGKSSVLARRFVEIFVRTDAKLSEVVAITFTEQAAGELRKRIHDVILERERGPGLGRTERLRMTKLRNQLSSAVIGTIHSFCARILRMYPAEADIDASFGVLEGPERVRLVTEAIAETFSDSMGRGDGTGPSAEFRDLLRSVPPLKLERFLVRMFSQREQLHRLFSGRPPQSSGGNAGTEAGHDAGIAGSVAARAFESDWTGNARETALAAGGKDAARVLAILGGGEASAPAGPARTGEILAAVDGLIFTKDGTFRKSFLGTIPATALPRRPSEYLLAFESRYGGILRDLRDPGIAGSIREYDRLIASLEGVFLEAQKRYRAKKDDLGVLDFEDLQIMTRDLLHRDGVRERLRADYRFFLIDEFQDTNALQYEILKDLLGDFRSGNLFIVGDPKQSIYGFRNADVGVFYDAGNDIAGETRRSGAGPEDGGSIVLGESFRPLPAVAAFVNAIFSSLMSRGGSRFEVDYQQIIVGRNAAGEGAVEMLLVPDAPERDRAAAVRAECGLLAARLREIACGGDAAYSFGQCAVLLRDRTNLPALEKAFEEAGIPYLLAGGVGFFQTQEIYDFLNYLKFLIAPDDDPSLAGILRSPFFGLSDTDLYEVSFASPPQSRAPARPRGGASLWEKLRGFAEDPGAPGRIRRAERILSSHRDLADRIPVPRLLRRIAADTGWIGTMAGLSHGPQHRENLLKLLELARKRGTTGPLSLYDFTVYLGDRAEEEEREGQAATGPSGKAVRVMTVHAAKGLEFPVVFLPFLDRASRPDLEPIINPEFGIGFHPAAVEDGDEVPAPRYAFLRALSEEKRVAEEKRIFYVGCTRAMDLLVLSAAERAAPVRNSPLGWLKEVMEESAVAEADSVYDFGDRKVLFLERSGGTQEHRARVLRLRVRVRRPGDAGATAIPRSSSSGRHREPSRILTGLLADTRGGEAYTATRLAAYMTCPALYYLRYVLGAGEASGRDPGDDGAANSTGPGRAALEGELTHLVLSGLQGPVPGESIAERVSLSASSLGAGAEDPDLAGRVAGHVAAFLLSKAGRAILSGRDARTEFQISALLGDAVVTGKIDRLFRGADGLIEFVDYKTESVSAGETASRAESHKSQIAVYAWLISRLYDQHTVRGTVLFLRAPSVPAVFRFDSAEIGRIGRDMTEAVAAIRQGRFTPPGTPCRECPGGNRCTVIPARR